MSAKSTRFGFPLTARVRATQHLLGDAVVQFGTDIYYRFVFGRTLPLPATLDRWVSVHEQSRRGDIPLARDIWEAHYRDGRWDYLGDQCELARYSVIASYLRFGTPDADILDVGCGEGLLAYWLDGHYRSYLGVDISAVATARGNARLSDQHTQFQQMDAEQNVPSGVFDAIVFNESLYYFVDPLDAFERYRRVLAPGGTMSVSMYRGSARAMAILRCLKERYPVMDHVSVGTARAGWDYCLFFGRRGT